MINLKKNTKADDGEWKQWVSKLILKTKSPVLPIFFDGQNSQLYHIANKQFNGNFTPIGSILNGTYTFHESLPARA